MQTNWLTLCREASDPDVVSVATSLRFDAQKVRYYLPPVTMLMSLRTRTSQASDVVGVAVYCMGEHSD